MRRAVLAFVAILAFLAPPAAAQNLTVRDIVELSRSGLGEDVLLALIEVNRGIYSIDPETLKSLKQAGISDRVIVALVRSGREQAPAALPPVQAQVDPAPAEPQPQPQPQVVVIEHREPDVREVMVPVPVYVAVPSWRRGHGRVHTAVTESNFIPFQSGPPAVRPVVQQPKQPVYWGFGGKLRPDAWDPHPHGKGRSGRR